MTLRETHEFLTDKKVFVKNKGKEVQEKLFNIGFKWVAPEEKGIYKDRYFLFLYEDLTLTYVDVDDIEYFYEHRFKEISAEDILNIKVEHLPKTWEEFCKNNPINVGEVALNSCSVIIPLIAHRTRYTDIDKCSFPNSSAAKTHMALMQLHQLRDCYRQGWVPDWKNSSKKYAITRVYDFIDYKIKLKIDEYIHTTLFLTFPTLEIAQEFLNNFRDLIEEAGDLI